MRTIYLIALVLGLFVAGTANAQINGSAQLDTLGLRSSEARFMIQCKYRNLYLHVGEKGVVAQYAEQGDIVTIDYPRILVDGIPMGDINENVVPIVYPPGTYFDKNGDMIPANQQSKSSWQIVPSGQGNWVYIKSYWGRYLTVEGADKPGMFKLGKRYNLLPDELLETQMWKIIRVQ